MKFLIKSILLSSIALVLCSNAEASLLTNLLDFDGTADTLQDASVGKIINKSGGDATVLEAGDLIQGLIYFNQIDGTSAGTGSYQGTVWAAYAFEVDTVAADGSSYTLRGADVLSVIGGDGNNPVDARQDTDYQGRVSGGAVSSIALLENTTTNALNLSGTNGSLGLNGNLTSDWSIVLTASLNQYVAQAEAGIDLKDLTSNKGTSGDPFADFYATFSVTGHSLPVNEFLPILNSKLTTINGSNTYGEISITDGRLLVTDPSTDGSNWDFADDGNYKINPIPEPSTIAIWAVLGLGGCGVVARRRSKAKKA